MDINGLKDLTEKNKVSPIYVFSGDEEFFIREALSTVKLHLLKDTDPSLSLVELKGNEIPGGVIFDELRTLPFFAGKNKVVIVEEADDFVEKNRQTLERYLETPATHANLVLICKKWDKRTKLAIFVDKVGVSVECKKLKDHLLPGWLHTRARYYKKNISTRAAQKLVEDVGNNLAILDKHIEKLSIYLGDRASIDEKDIDALVGVDRDRTVFELTDAVAQKNVTLALKILNQMLTHGEDSVILPGWLHTRARYYKKNISTRAAQKLVEDVGNNLAILDKHIEKLSIYLGDRASIDEKDIDALVGVDRDRTVFELTDAVAQKNVTLALKILNQMLTHGEDSVRIISLLAWQVKRLWRAKQILNGGGDEPKVVSELQIIQFFAKRFFEQVKLYTEEDLTKKYALLLEVDVKSKTSSFSPQLLLELLVYKLCV